LFLCLFFLGSVNGVFSVAVVCESFVPSVRCCLLWVWFRFVLFALLFCRLAAAPYLDFFWVGFVLFVLSGGVTFDHEVAAAAPTAEE
jgi:hypothetical protein